MEQDNIYNIEKSKLIRMYQELLGYVAEEAHKGRKEAMQILDTVEEIKNDSKKKVDIWLGIDHGYAEIVEGFLLSDEEIEITDPDFLDSAGFDEPWIVKAKQLTPTTKIKYDALYWSKLGLIKPEENGTIRTDKHEYFQR